LIVEEQVFDGHYRVVAVKVGGRVVYSVDYYARLPRVPSDCSFSLELEGAPSSLCYVPLGGGCEAAIVVSPRRVELVSLRLVAPLDADPAGGSLAEARRLCVERAESWLRGFAG